MALLSDCKGDQQLFRKWRIPVAFYFLLLERGHSLWNRALIDECRIKRGDQPERLRRVVVAVDPPGGASKANAECGIIVAALGADRHGYVLADLSGRMSPEQWARRVVEAYHGYKADKIVAEQNFGGAMVEFDHPVHRFARPDQDGGCLPREADPC